MSKVTTGFSMSLDGFVADENDAVDRVFKWYSIGDTMAEVQIGDSTLTMATEGAEYIKGGGQAAGVLVSARRTFDLAKAWGGRHPMDVPVVVVTHAPPEEWIGRQARRSPLSLTGYRAQSRRHERSPGRRTSS